MLSSQIESILFISTKPVTIKELAKLGKRSVDEVEVALEELINKYNQTSSGINIIINNNYVEMAASAENSYLLESFVKHEVTSELTQPQLEALTIIAYRAPVTKSEIEQIRGVNCSIILRNLMVKGLVQESYDKRAKVEKYIITHKFMEHLGISQVEELPEYDKLSKSETLDEVLKNSEN